MQQQEESISSRYNKGLNGRGHAGNRHGLEPDFSRSGQNGIEKPFSAQKLIFQSLYLLDVNGYSALKAQHIAGIHNHFLSCLQGILYHFTVYLNKGNAVSGQLLHNKTLAAEETGARFFIEMDG